MCSEKKSYAKFPNYTDTRMISHKGIEFGIITDAPFIGARICAMSCGYACPGCINKELINAPFTIEYCVDIIKAVHDNGLSDGIILGGLEWTEQPEEMLSLIALALRAGMKVILYTHHELNYMLETFPVLRGLNIYIKCGGYREDLKGYFDEPNDVLLASSNQKIFQMLEY